MDALVSAITLMAIAISVLLFFGPLLVISSILGELKVQDRKIIDLSGTRLSVRVIIAVIGLATWLAIYIPLVTLAYKALNISTETATPETVTPTFVVDSSRLIPSNTQISDRSPTSSSFAITKPAPEATSTENFIISVNVTETPTPSETPVPIEMVKVVSGSYMMGSSYYQDQDFDFEPAHKVYIDEFYIDLYEVTNSQYSRCVETGACNPPLFFSSNTRINYFDDLDAYGNYPVIFVSWSDALNYCNWRNARLPTEAEWEMAAKWNPIEHITYLYPWGTNAPPAFDKVNYHSDDTTEVGHYPRGRSWVGAFDMAGNVLEWVNDFYSEDYYLTSPELNPFGPQSTSLGHVVRGGAWSSSDQIFLWTFYRDYFIPTTTRNDLGFRCASNQAP